MDTAILYLILTILWLISLVVSFVGGFYLCRIKKRTTKPKKPTKAEINEMEQLRKEYENFMSYDGTEQNAIND